VDRRLTTWAAVHAAAAGLHGLPHEWASVALADWQTAFVAATTLGPFAAAWLADRRPRAGGWAFTAVMAASVAFGVAHHWLLAGVDNVENVAHHRAAFEATAALAVFGAAGVLAGYSRASRCSERSSSPSSR
jgi:hypothetical protein